MVVPVNAKSSVVDELPDDIEKPKELLAQRDAKIAAQRVVIEHLRKMAFGKKSEKRPRSALLVEASGQGHLFHAELLAEAERTAKAKRVQGEITLDPPKRAAPRKGCCRLPETAAIRLSAAGSRASEGGPRWARAGRSGARVCEVREAAEA
jgi:hypothetical protein